MNISSATAAANIGVTTPTQPAVATRQVQDDTLQPNGGAGVAGRILAKTGNTETVAAVQDPQQTHEIGKGQGKGQPKKEQVEQAVSSVNDYIDKLRHRELTFSLDDKNGQMVVKLVDTETKKVIRQIPPEYMLRLADTIGKDKGWLVEQKA
ncbi:flagellar protein FlaG [Gammaproteobacteria bacterium]